MPATVKLNAIQVLALSAFGVVLGNWLKRRVPLLEYLNIPAAIVGGLIYSLLVLVLRDRWMNFDMDLVLRDILMIAFFTTIGMGASISLVRKGGPQVLWFFILATVGAVLQNVVGIAGATALGLDALLGIVSGSVALTGGPATARSRTGMPTSVSGRWAGRAPSTIHGSRRPGSSLLRPRISSRPSCQPCCDIS